MSTHVKLCKADQNDSVLFFECDFGEMHFRRFTETGKQLKKQDQWARDQNMDVRVYMRTPVDVESPKKLRFVEITIPRHRDGKDSPIVIITDWDAFLLSASGKTLERLFRYGDD